MSDLISRQDAIDAIKKAYWDSNLQSAKEDPCVIDAMTDWAIKQIKGLPSAQPEIIRCRDCEYGEQDEVGRWFCRGIGCQIGDEDGNGFCADAERRNNE